MRPALVFSILLCLLLTVNGVLVIDNLLRGHEEKASRARLETLTRGLGLTDLAVATEARYTRHPAVSDMMAPFMDHPGAIEHFPTGTFWLPPPR